MSTSRRHDGPRATPRPLERSARPETAEQWLARAEEVADILAADAVERDQTNQPPHAEIQLLKSAGLVTVLGPKAFGGAELPWHVEAEQGRCASSGAPTAPSVSCSATIASMGVGRAARGHQAQMKAVEELYTSNNFFSRARARWSPATRTS